MKRPLEDIIGEVNRLCTIYNIHYCNAGWGFILYYNDGYEKKWKEVPHDSEHQMVSNWKEGLKVTHYYPTIREAAEETLKILKKEEEKVKEKGDSIEITDNIPTIVNLYKGRKNEKRKINQ